MFHQLIELIIHLKLSFYNDNGDLNESLNIINPYFDEYGVDKENIRIKCFQHTLIVCLKESKRFIII